MKGYDVVIIGSGLGGLECASILSREGYNVCVLEQHSQAGGCLQNFTRDGCVFDTGLHYMGGLDEGQVLNKYFKYFGLLEKLKMKRLDSEAFDVVGFADDGSEYGLAMGHHNFVNKMLQYFPDERPALEKYISKITEICEHFPLYNLRHKSLYTNEIQFFRENAFHFFNAITKNEMLKTVFAGTNPLYAGVREKTPLYVYALTCNSFIESSWKIIGGSSQVADIFTGQIRNNGGTVLTNARAEKFIFKNDKLTAVQLENKEILEASYFISGIHPLKTIGMIEGDYLRKAYRKRINALENTTSNFTMYVVFKPGSFEYLNHNVYYYRNKNVWITRQAADDAWPGGFIMITPASSENEKYAVNATIMSYMNIEDVRKWEHTCTGHRGDDYIEFKKRKAEQLLELVECRYPGFRKTIKKYYTSTPLTYRDYTGTVDGSMYGILKDSSDPMKTLMATKTKIPNLFLTGQNIILHGILGVTIGAVTTCSDLLGREYLVDKINRA